MSRPRTDREPPQVVTNSALVEVLRAGAVDWVTGDPAPDQVALRAGWLLDQLTSISDEISVIRTVAVRQLRAQDWTLAEIGHHLGLSRARVDQIANR